MGCKQRLFANHLIFAISIQATVSFIFTVWIPCSGFFVYINSAAKNKLSDTPVKGTNNTLGIFWSIANHINDTIKMSSIMHLFFECGVILTVTMQYLCACYDA